MSNGSSKRKKPETETGGQLYRIVPAVYRDRDNADETQRGDLGKYLDAFGVLLDQVKARCPDTAVILVTVWLGFPYMFLVVSGALQAIPEELKEAFPDPIGSFYFTDYASSYLSKIRDQMGRKKK